MFASSPIFPLTSQTPTTLSEHDERLGPDERSHCDDLRHADGFTQTHSGVQAKAGPTAVHVGAANQETQSTAVHVGAAAVQVGAANETQLRAVHVGAAIQETQLQTVEQDMADAQADHDMADGAVVEHSHLHEDEEHVEWEHPDKGYFDEDDGTTLDPVQVRAGVEREIAFMAELGVGELCDRPKTGKVWSTRWCYRRKKVTQWEADLWCDSSEKEQIPVYMRVNQDQLLRGFCLHSQRSTRSLPRRQFSVWRSCTHQ